MFFVDFKHHVYLKAAHFTHTSCGKYPVNATFHSSKGVLSKQRRRKKTVYVHFSFKFVYSQWSSM